MTNIAQIALNSLIDHNRLIELNKEHINDLKDKAKQLIFPKKSFKIKDREKKYTVIYNFFESVPEIEFVHQVIRLYCIICAEPFSYALGDTTNLAKHLRIHNELDEWFKYYDE